MILHQKDNKCLFRSTMASTTSYSRRKSLFLRKHSLDEQQSAP